MNHRSGFNRLGRKKSHRKAMESSMVTSLFRYERITTTRPKALQVKRLAEKMITRAKKDTVHNRRMIARRIKDKGIVAKLFNDISLRFLQRPGGYTRVLKIGRRINDAAEIAFLELVERKTEERNKKKREKE